MVTKDVWLAVGILEPTVNEKKSTNADFRLAANCVLVESTVTPSPVASSILGCVPADTDDTNRDWAHSKAADVLAKVSVGVEYATASMLSSIAAMDVLLSSEESNTTCAAELYRTIATLVPPVLADGCRVLTSCMQKSLNCWKSYDVMPKM